jgi:hypothetical protein
MSTATPACSSRSDRAFPFACRLWRLAGAPGVALFLAAAPVRAQPVDPGPPLPGTRSLYLLDVPFLHFGPLDLSQPRPGTGSFDLQVGYGNTFSHTWHPQAIHNEFQRNGLPFSLEEAETLHGRQTADFIAFVDGEVTRAALRGSWGLSDRFSLAVEIPFVSYDAVHLEGAIETFHGALGLYDGQRRNFPADQFVIVRQRPSGRLEYDNRMPAAGLSDVTATLRYRDRLESGLAFSADVTLKAPTGDANEYRGSGSVDAGVLVGALYRFGTAGRWGVRVEGGYVVPGSYRGHTVTTFEVASFARLLAAADVRVGRNTFLALSATWEQSSFRRDAVGDEAAPSLDVTLGISRRFGEHLLASLALVENVPSLGDSTDIALALAIKFVP